MVTAAGTAAVIGVGAYQAVQRQITAGDLLVVLTYIGQIYEPLEQLTTTITNLQKQFIGLRRLRPAGHRARRRGEAGRRTVERVRGEVEFRGVGFGYEGVPAFSRTSVQSRPASGRARRGDRGRKVDAGQPAASVLRPGGGRVLLDGRMFAT